MENPKMISRPATDCRVRLLSVLLLVLGLGGCGREDDAGERALPAPAPPSAGGPIAMSRLTESQYRQTIADVFGPDIEIFGRFEPDQRRDRLLAVGSAWASITPAGFEQYDTMARGIARQLLAPERRARFVPCTPAAPGAPDAACVSRVLDTLGERLFRRPLAAAEREARVALASEAASVTGDFYTGLEYALASLLVAPEFLFRIETAEPDPARPGAMRLDAYSRAARLSFLLWNSAPDDALLAAAGRGELLDARGLARQVERLLDSPHLERGVRALFADLLAFDRFEEVSKDSQIFPAYSPRFALDAQEQTLRTVVGHLLERDGDYRALFTLRDYPMTRALGPVYAVPVAAREGWELHRLADADPRAGLLGQASLMALHAHAGRSSPTLRGKFVRETFLCQQIPAPPADVDFTMDAESAQLPTARERLERHRKELSCSGCHQLMDTVGLTLENLDGIGALRSRENGAPIDASGELDGVRFSGAAGLGQALHDHPQLPACFIDTVYAFAAGRAPVSGERAFMLHLGERFAASGYRLRALLRALATSEAFYAVSEMRGSTT